MTAAPAVLAASAGLKASPPRINFGKVVFGATGATSAQKIVKVSNPRNGQPITELNGQLEGTDPGDFHSNSNCESTLAPGAAPCEVMLTFTPTALGLRSASLVISDSASATAATITLTGTGEAGKISVKPLALSFAKTNIGNVSASQTVTLTNPNPVALNIGPLAVTGPFVQNNSCGSQLAGSNATCDIAVRFQPVSAAKPKGTIETGTLSISDDALKSPQIVKLKGIAVSSPTVAPTATATTTATPTATPTSTPFATPTGGASPTPTATPTTIPSATPTSSPMPGNASAPAFVPVLQ